MWKFSYNVNRAVVMYVAILVIAAVLVVASIVKPPQYLFHASQ